MKVLVTGANGFLGSGIVKKLLDNGNEVIALDISDENIDKRAQIICENLFENFDCSENFKNIDVLLHLAWRDGFVHNSEKHIEDLPKHVRFIKKMMECGAKKIAVMGTMHEVGFYEGSIDEDTKCDPLNLYGIAKNALREICELMAKENDIQFQWLRGFYIVSKSTIGNSIFSKIMMASEKGESVFPFTLGQNQYDFLDYEDFCNMTVKVIEQNDVLGIINICSGRPEKLADRVERFIKDNNLNIKLDYGKFPDRPYDSKAVWGNDKKINKIMKGC